MDLDRISTRTAELAAKLEIQPPRIETGTVPRSCTAGLYARIRKQPVLVVGSAFERLTVAEQDGALAEHLVALDLLRAGRPKSRVAIMVITLALLTFLLLGVGGYIDAPPWQAAFAGGLVGLAMYMIVTYVVMAFWSRRITYQTDRRLAVVFGRPFMNFMLDLDARLRSQPLGVAGPFLKLAMPSEARRAHRLDAIVPAPARSTITSP
ncbi:hypothetical protein [Nocardia sp. CA-120079]|uniref:hypothetical protein n=1 Tax=Nocardia sp. CA-120079 TaxID=3239974 RepID=UPI003D96591C